MVVGSRPEIKIQPTCYKTLLLHYSVMKRKKQAPIFNISIDETGETGVNLVSFVSRPAIESDFIALAKEACLALAKDEHKQILTGPVLIPNKQIFRLSESQEPYYIQFSAETIEGIRNKFFKQGHTTSTNYEHELALDGNYVVESWIVADSDKDKSAAIGLPQLPPGTWMLSYHVPDKEFWLSEIMSGKVKGFSLEGFFKQEEIKEQLSLADEPTMKNGLLGRLYSQFMSTIKVSELALSDGTHAVVDDTTKEVFKKEANGDPGDPLPDGNYSLADGSTITVKDSKLSEEGLAATDLVAGDYNLPGGDVLTVTEGDYSINKAEAEPSAEEELSTAKEMISDLTRQLNEANAAKLAAEKQVTEQQDAATKLAAEKQELETKLAAKPGAVPVKLGGDKGPDSEVKLSKSQQRLAELREKNTKK